MRSTRTRSHADPRTHSAHSPTARYEPRRPTAPQTHSPADPRARRPAAGAGGRAGPHRPVREVRGVPVAPAAGHCGRNGFLRGAPRLAVTRAWTSCGSMPDGSVWTCSRPRTPSNGSTRSGRCARGSTAAGSSRPAPRSPGSTPPGRAPSGNCAATSVSWCTAGSPGRLRAVRRRGAHDGALARVNEAARTAPPTPRAVRGEDGSLVRALDRPPECAALLAAVARDTVELLTDPVARAGLRQCAGDNCPLVYSTCPGGGAGAGAPARSAGTGSGWRGIADGRRSPGVDGAPARNPLPGMRLSCVA